MTNIEPIQIISDGNIWPMKIGGTLAKVLTLNIAVAFLLTSLSYYFIPFSHSTSI
jgi:hypothetical protein